MPGRGPEIQVQGLSELRRALTRARVDLKELTQANRKVSELITPVARFLAPRRSGRLAVSIRADSAPGRASIRAGYSRTQVPYAGPIHWGWPAHHIAANQWGVRAISSTEHEWLPIYEREIQTLMDKVERQSRG